MDGKVMALTISSGSLERMDTLEEDLKKKGYTRVHADLPSSDIGPMQFKRKIGSTWTDAGEIPDGWDIITWEDGT